MHVESEKRLVDGTKTAVGCVACRLNFMPLCLQITQFVLTGAWSDGQYKEVLELCMGGCAQLDAVARQCLQQSLTPA